MEYLLSILILAAVITGWMILASRWRSFRGGCGACSALPDKDGPAGRCCMSPAEPRDAQPGHADEGEADDAEDEAAAADDEDCPDCHSRRQQYGREGPKYES